MGKFFVRISIIIVTIYFLISYIVAQLFGINLFENYYVVIFEFIVVIYCYSEGKYHCVYMKHCSLGIFMSDTITRLDYAYDFLSVTSHNLIPIFILSLSILVSLISAFIHFNKVRKLKRLKNGRKVISYKKGSIEVT